MNKSQLISAVAGDTGETKRATETIINGVISAISKAIAAGERVEIAGFGIVSVVAKPERLARNPSTGEQITIKAKNAVKIKPAKQLQDAANGA